MSAEMEIKGGAGPLETAAILAALARLFEEEAWAAAFPAPPPRPGAWVLSGRPAPIDNPFLHRPAVPVSGWGAAENGGTAGD